MSFSRILVRPSTANFVQRLQRGVSSQSRLFAVEGGDDRAKKPLKDEEEKNMESEQVHFLSADVKAYAQSLRVCQVQHAHARHKNIL